MNRPSKRIFCEVCDDEIRPGTNGAGCYFGLLSWLVQDVPGGIASSDFLVHHKVHCDRRRNAYTMGLDTALGPHGLATLVHFMTEPNIDRESLERVMHRLYFTEGRIHPTAIMFDRKYDDYVVRLAEGRP